MQGGTESKAIAWLKWCAIPVAVFGFGFFGVSAMLNQGNEATQDSVEHTAPRVEVNDKPIEPGTRKWIPVHPPQVNVSVTRSQPDEEPEATEEDLSPPDSTGETSNDDGSFGGLEPPTVVGGGTDSSTAGGTDDSGEDVG